MNEQEAIIGKLHLSLRGADKRYEPFVYELMHSSLGDFFDRNTEEGLSRVKFRQGFHPRRVTIIEHEGMPVGFFDFEKARETAIFHTQCISEDYRGRGLVFLINRLVIQEAKSLGAKRIRGKIFKDSPISLAICRRFGYNLSADLPKENSYLVERRVNG